MTCDALDQLLVSGAWNRRVLLREQWVSRSELVEHVARNHQLAGLPFEDETQPFLVHVMLKDIKQVVRYDDAQHFRSSAGELSHTGATLWVGFDQRSECLCNRCTLFPVWCQVLLEVPYNRRCEIQQPLLLASKRGDQHVVSAVEWGTLCSVQRFDKRRRVIVPQLPVPPRIEIGEALLNLWRWIFRRFSDPGQDLPIKGLNGDIARRTSCEYVHVVNESFAVREGYPTEADRQLNNSEERYSGANHLIRCVERDDEPMLKVETVLRKRANLVVSVFIGNSLVAITAVLDELL